MRDFETRTALALAGAGLIGNFMLAGCGQNDPASANQHPIGAQPLAVNCTGARIDGNEVSVQLEDARDESDLPADHVTLVINHHLKDSITRPIETNKLGLPTAVFTMLVPKPASIDVSASYRGHLASCHLKGQH